MKMVLLILALVPLAASAAPVSASARNPAIVKQYIRNAVGDQTIKAIQKREGGAAFLRRFFGDIDWMEQFAGSGMWSIDPWKGLKDNNECAAKALLALDLLVWNDKDDFIATAIGRNIATALALNHGIDFPDEKLVQIMECYREWAQDGTLHSDAWKHDVRQWREVLGFGQNAELSVENLRWIHDFANVPGQRYYGVCWLCHYRLWNCFGASVHGPMYYAPWTHRWNTQELRYRVGGVCGALSKFGSHSAASHGIRAFTAGQPAHCAYVLWDYAAGRWGVAYSVTLHTGPHNSLGSQGFAALEEIDRYYSNPKRMEAERLRWAGEYAKAMKACPGNYHAGVEWYAKLESENAAASEWDRFGATVRETFDGSPSQGWALYHGYLAHVADGAKRLDAAKAALRMIRESKAETFETPYWDEIALKKLAAKATPEECWEIFAAALEGQAKTRTFYRQTIDWGAGLLMTDQPSSMRFIKMVGDSALKTGEKISFREMILKASESEDISMFRQVYRLMDKLDPELPPKKTRKSWPKLAYGGTLLSPDGIVKLSSSCEWDNPVTYRNALDADDFEGGNAFHTGKANAPWAMVVLPGKSEITGIVVVNSGGGQNRERQVPLRIWLSENGSDFTEVFASSLVQDEWECKLASPVSAKYIKVGRLNDPNSADHFFHLHKILVYGKKLY